MSYKACSLLLESLVTSFAKFVFISFEPNLNWKFINMENKKSSQIPQNSKGLEPRWNLSLHYEFKLSNQYTEVEMKRK